MGKRDECLQEIKKLMDYKDLPKVKTFLKENSNLPGPRGNIELAYAFSDYFNGVAIEKEIWDFICDLYSVESKTNEPEEIIPFCATLTFGNIIFSVDDGLKIEILDKIRSAMSDKRWRMREASAMSLQIIAEKDFDFIEEWFSSIYSSCDFYEKRGIIATLAHPPILKDENVAKFSIDICRKILNEIPNLTKDDLKSEGFVVLKKGLDYAPSVFVAHFPDEGFEMLEEFAKLNNKTLNSILKSNLGKARLKKKFSSEVDRIILEK